MTPLTIGEWAAITAVVDASKIPGRRRLIDALTRTREEAVEPSEPASQGDKIRATSEYRAANEAAPEVVEHSEGLTTAASTPNRPHLSEGAHDG